MKKTVTTGLLEFILLAFLLFPPALVAEGERGITGMDTKTDAQSLQQLTERINRMETYLKELQDQIVVLMEIIDHVEKESNRNDTAHAELEARNRELQKKIELLDNDISTSREKIDFMYRQYRFDFVEPRKGP